MNIFVLDEDFELCAQYHNDRHVVKMIVELAQLLSTAHHQCPSENYGLIKHVIYKETHKNHPCAIWVRQCTDNYDWTYNLLACLIDEYYYRYGKIHKTSELLLPLSLVPKLPNLYPTQFAQAMPDYCKNTIDAVDAYRRYYNEEKQHLAKWTKREVPKWFKKKEKKNLEI